MSKFFNETQKAHQWAQQQASRDLDVKQVLDTLNQGNTVGQVMADAHLQRCDKIRLAPPPNTPVIFSAGTDQDHVAAESFRALRMRLTRLQASGGLRSVVLTSAVPGEGKTVTALNLALCCAQLDDTRVLLVDADLRTRGLTQLLGNPSRPGLAGILEGRVEFEHAILGTDYPNLYILEAGKPATSPSELFASAKWREFLGWAGECFKLILVDAPPIAPLADFELISVACGGVLVVVRALRTQREVLQRAVSAVDPNKLLGAVLNGMSKNGRDGYRRDYHSEEKQK